MSIECKSCFGFDTEAECLLLELEMKVLVIPWFALIDESGPPLVPSL